MTEKDFNAKVKELEEKHGKIFAAIVPLDQDDHTNPEKQVYIFLKRPDRQSREAIGAMFDKSTGKAIEMALKNMAVDCKESIDKILETDHSLFACDEIIGEALTVHRAILKKK